MRFFSKAPDGGKGSGVTGEGIRVQVKSQQNWKSEWELAHFRAHFEAEVNG